MEQDKGASLRDRAVVNGAGQAVSALRASVPSAANDRCTCAEVQGEDPDCALHGVETDWAVENTSPYDWQNMVIEYRLEIADLEARPTQHAGAELWQVFRKLCMPVPFWHDEAGWRRRAGLFAQAIEARRAETQGGSVHESAVAESDAPESGQP